MMLSMETPLLYLERMAQKAQESNGVYKGLVLSHVACGWQACILLNFKADRVLANNKGSFIPYNMPVYPGALRVAD
jgi:hypothetical protein